MTLIVGSVIGVGMAGQRPTVTPADSQAAISLLAVIAWIVAGEAGTSEVTGAGTG